MRRICSCLGLVENVVQLVQLVHHWIIQEQLPGWTCSFSSTEEHTVAARHGSPAERLLGLNVYRFLIPRALVGYEMEIHVTNKQRSAELAITNFISNKREWNTCFTKFPIFDDAVWMYYKCCLNLINQKSMLLPSAWIKWTWTLEMQNFIIM